jgi:hypothetical protein
VLRAGHIKGRNTRAAEDRNHRLLHADFGLLLIHLTEFLQ